MSDEYSVSTGALRLEEDSLRSDRLWGPAAIVAIAGLFFLIDYASYSATYAITYGLLAIGLVLPLVNLRLGLCYFIVISSLSDDVPRVLSLTAKSFTSVHFTQLGPFTLTVYWTLYLFFCAAVFYLVKRPRIRLSRADKAMAGLGTVFLLAAGSGLGNLTQFPREFIQDASYFVNMAILYFFIRTAYHGDRRHLRDVVSIIAISYGVRFAIGIAYYFLGIGTPVGMSLRVSYDTGGTMASFVFLLSFAFMALVTTSKWQKAVLLLFAFGSAFQILTFASRGDLLFTVIGGVLILAVAGRELLSRTSRARFARNAFVLIASTLLIAMLFSPGAAEYLGWKVRSIFELNPAETAEYSTYSPATRVIEAINILRKEEEEGSLLWGEGLGGWFNDEYLPFPFKIMDASAYDPEHILMGKLFKPHGTPLVVLLKMGLVGLVVYYFCMLIFWRDALAAHRKLASNFWRAFSLAMIGFLPLLFYKNYSSKLQVLFGILVAIVAVAQDQGGKSPDTLGTAAPVTIEPVESVALRSRRQDN